MNDAEKFTKMRSILDKPIAQITATMDQEIDGTLPAEAGHNPGMLAGLVLARFMLTTLEDSLEWKFFRARLRHTVETLTKAPGAGQITAYAMWDGLHFAAVEAGRLDGEQVDTHGRPVSQEDQAADA